MKGLMTFILLVCFVGGVLWATGVLPIGNSGGAEEIQPVKTAATRAEALKLAKDEDLPAIAQSTKVFIKQFDVVSMKRRQITIESEDVIKEIVNGLPIAQERERAAAIRVFTLKFYRDDELVRTVYVDANNEWGVDRPGGTYWIIGKNNALPVMLSNMLLPAKWTD